MTVILAIDPLLLEKAHDKDPNCIEQVNDLKTNPALFQIASDHRSELLNAYAKFIDSARVKTSVIDFVTKLLGRSRIEIVTCNPLPCSNLQTEELLEVSRGCLDHWEQLFLCMADSQSRMPNNSKLTILSSGDSGRCFEDRNVQSAVEENVDGVKIRFASQKERLSKWEPETINQRQQDSMFEQQLAEYVSRKYSCECKERKKFSRKSCNGNEKWEIDIYRYQKRSNGERLVCIGECKLRHSSEKKVSLAEIKQLWRNMTFADQHEAERMDNTISIKYKIQGLFFSNAEEVDEIALDWIKEKKLPILIYRVVMPIGWQSHPDWDILDNNISLYPSQ